MLKRSNDHLLTAGETYLQHLRFALLVGFITIGAGLACIVHAIVPAFCERTCSRTLGQLSILFADRRQLQRFEDEASGVFTFAALVLLSAATVSVPAAAGGPLPLVLAVGAMAFSIPAVFLSTNPELEPVTEA
ncbi:MAG TPA: DUF6356 family protein [Sphingomicrobium sp.]